MKKLFTLAAAVLASFSLWAALPLTALPEGATSLVNYGSSWTTKDKNVTIFDDNNYFMALSQGNALSFDANGAKLGNSSKTSAVVFYVSAPSDIDVVVARNGSDMTATLYYMGTSIENLTSSNIDQAGTLCSSDAISGSNQSATLSTKAGAAGYYKVHGTLRFYLTSVTITPAVTCTDPEFTVSPTEGTGFVGDPIDINVSTKNQSKPIKCAVTIDGVEGEIGTDYIYSASIGLVQATPLKAGTFVVTFTQASNGTYCDAEKSATFVINEKTPVTTVTVGGPAAGFVGKELTYTATAANATAYEWYLDDVKQGSDSAKFIYTAVKGNHTIVCKARNEFNAEDAWIASDPIALKVTDVSGEIIKATLTSGSAATVTGLVGGTADVNLSSSQKMDNGRYFGITLASGTFQEGDTVVIVLTKVGSNYPCLFGDKDRTILLYLAKETSGALEYKIVLPAAANGLSSLYLSRNDNDNYKWNPTISSIAVIRPEQPDHVDVALVGATVNEVALGEEDITTLLTNKELNIATSYVDAPTVTFVKHSDIYYEGESEPVSKNENIEVIATEVAGAWQAQATIGDETYTITLAKTTSFTVHYMDGENELGTENVAANGTVAKYADFQSKTMATFVGWYQDVDLTIEAVLTAPITAETYLYAKFENKYAASINIEQLC